MSKPSRRLKVKILRRPRTQKRYTKLAEGEPVVSSDDDKEILTIIVPGEKDFIVIEMSHEDWSRFYGEVFDAMPNQY